MENTQQFNKIPITSPFSKGGSEGDLVKAKCRLRI